MRALLFTLCPLVIVYPPIPQRVTAPVTRSGPFYLMACEKAAARDEASDGSYDG
jgi:hypothetical protein